MNTVRVEERLLDRNAHNLAYKYAYPMPDVEYITIHNTWGYGSADAEGSYLNKRNDKAFVSFHFAVDEKGAIQLIPCDISAWHAGDSGEGSGNRKSIGIEICRSRCEGNKALLYRKAEENAVHLAAYLLDQYGLDIDRLKKHQDWSGKYCPHRILAEQRWDEFREAVRRDLEKVRRRYSQKQ